MTQAAPNASTELVARQPTAEVLPIGPHARMRTRTLDIYDRDMFDQMQRIAKLMSFAAVVPQHLRDGNETIAMANCFLVVNQARAWDMDPFAVAQHTFVQNGRIGYGGQLVAAVLESQLGMKLEADYSGEGEDRKIRLSDPNNAKRYVEGTVREWQTRAKDGGKVNFAWASQPDQQLYYRGTRQWARRYEPGALLGVYTDDEVASMNAVDVTPRREAPRGEAPKQEAKAAPAKESPVTEAKSVPEPEREADPEAASDATSGADGDVVELWPEHTSTEFLEMLEASLGVCATKAEVLEVLQHNKETVETKLAPAYLKRAREMARKHMAGAIGGKA